MHWVHRRPGYGTFAITHHLAAVRSLETALGHAFGLDVKGLRSIPRYYVDMGATGYARLPMFYRYIFIKQACLKRNASACSNLC